MNTENKRKATIWHNGKSTTLTNGDYSAEANSIAVSGDDVYTVGHEMNREGNSVAMLWKNGEAIALSDGKHLTDATSVYISDHDVYVIGEELESGIATLWKNEEVIKRTSKVRDKGGGTVLALALSNGFNVASSKSVYLTGTPKDIVSKGEKIEKYIVKMWKDGKPTILNKLNNKAMALSVCTWADNVYVAGGVFTDEMIPNATLWKNGEPVTLSKSDLGSYANAVHVSGNDIYVAGRESINKERSVAILWKNGTPTELTDGYNHAEAKSVYVSGDIVYVSGYIQ